MKNQHILYIVLAVTIILLMALAYDSATRKEEGFENGCPTLPMKSTTIYKKNGKKSCCYASVNGEKCMEPEQNECILGNAQGAIPECNTYVNSFKTANISMCPKSMPNIFFTNSAIGCTDGPLNQTETGPLHESSKKCILPVTRDSNGKFVPDMTHMQSSPDNCLYELEREELECIGNGCDRFVRTIPNGKGVLVGMDFTTNDGMRHTCYSSSSYRKMLEASGMTSTAINTIIQTHPSICSVSKKLYVDKSMSPADVKLLP
jgi:hypothetical protein